MTTINKVTDQIEVYQRESKKETTIKTPPEVGANLKD